VLISVVGGFGAVVGRTGFAEDASYVVADCVDADEQLFTNPPVCLASADNQQSFDFPSGETIRVASILTGAASASS